ncbi:hypothetical protein, partial [Stenotrophomonas sp. SrG]|uniref:hypothetical protein n=1 Tax=Stenotrophomonas sp. SrG TaxID=3414430 RepID=UPI003CE7FCB4
PALYAWIQHRRERFSAEAQCVAVPIFRIGSRLTTDPTALMRACDRTPFYVASRPRSISQAFASSASC